MIQNDNKYTKKVKEQQYICSWQAHNLKNLFKKIMHGLVGWFYGMSTIIELFDDHVIFCFFFTSNYIVSSN